MLLSFPEIVGRGCKQSQSVNVALFPLRKIVRILVDNLRAMPAHIQASGLYSAAAWNGPRSPSGSAASVSAIAAKSAATWVNRGPRSRRRSSI